MKKRTIKNQPIVSMAQARRLAHENPDALVEQIGLLLSERTMIKHERNALRGLLKEIMNFMPMKDETAEDMQHRIISIGVTAYMSSRKARFEKREDYTQEEE